MAQRADTEADVRLAAVDTADGHRIGADGDAVRPERGYSGVMRGNCAWVRSIRRLLCLLTLAAGVTCVLAGPGEHGPSVVDAAAADEPTAEEAEPAGRSFGWDITLVSRHGPPCPEAQILLELQDGAGAVLATHPVPLQFSSQGLSQSEWFVGPLVDGDYQIVAVETPCREGVPAGAALPLRLIAGEMDRSLQLVAWGSGPEWHLHYFGTTREVVARGLLLVESAEPIVLRNGSDRLLRPCRRTLRGNVSLVERFQTGWRLAGNLAFPAKLEGIAPGQAVELVQADYALVESPPPGETLETRLLRVELEPEPNSFVYDADEPGSRRRPFPGLCDTFLVEVPVQAPRETAQRS